MTMQGTRLPLATFALVMLATTPVLAARSKSVVAVFGVDGARARLNTGLSDKLTTYLGTELAASGIYAVVPPAKVRQRLVALRKASYKDRFDSSKQISIGKELAAQKTLATRVMRVGRKCVITSTLWDIRTGASERAAVVRGRCSASGLMDAFSVVAAKLTASMDRVMRDLDSRLARRRLFPGNWARQEGLRAVNERTASPYFYLPAGGAASLPLKSTSAEVKIVGVIAQVTVKQTYHNPGKRPLEAVYVFPGSTRAAIHGMRMKIGERIVEAEIKTKRRARKLYEQAKSDGKRASLLEQKASSVFSMSVANIMPGEQIGVELSYSELLVPKDGSYSFVYPTVVGPRYGGAGAAAGYAENPHLAAGQPAPYAFSFAAQVHSPIGIKRLTSPSHKIKVAYTSRTSAAVTLAQKGGGERDVVLRYSLAGDKVESGVLLYEGQDEKFFLAMIEPPKTVRKADVTPREYVFVVDVSGSMNGWPLRISKDLIRKLFADLRPKDYFNVVLFASSSKVLSRGSLRANQPNLQKAFNLIDSEQGGGGTQLLSALSTAYGLPKPLRRGLSRTVVVITDGFIVMEAPAYRFVRKHLNQANLFTFGIGSSVNRGLIEMLADAGMGRPFVVLNRQEASGVADSFRQYIDRPVLTDVRLKIAGLQTYDVVPKQVPDLMGQRPLVVMGKYRGKGRGTLSIDGYSSSGRYRKSLPLNPGLHRAGNWPLEVLWARKWSDLLMRQQRMLPDDEALKAAVAQVGLVYNIVTPFTSFVAVDQERVNPGGPAHQARQPLPTPAPTHQGGRTVPPPPPHSPPNLAHAGSATMASAEPEDADEEAMSNKLALSPSRRGCGCEAGPAATDLSLPLLLLGLLIWGRGSRLTRCVKQASRSQTTPPGTKT
jgi:Ca-activated chloride channel family protein